MRSFRIKKNKLAIIVVSALIGGNAVAYRHAFVMTHFSQVGKPTSRPEELSISQRARALVSGINLPRPENKKTPDALGLQYETHLFEGAFGLTLEGWLIRQSDNKGLVIIFHGYSGTKEKLLPVAKVLNEMGYGTFLVDFYGSGGSEGNSTSIGYYEADDVAAAVEYAKESLGEEEPILYAVSMGAAAVLRAVQTYELRVKAVIIEAPFDTMLNTVSHRFAAMGIPAFPGAYLLVFWGGMQNDFNGFGHNPVDYARGNHNPTLLMAGTEDSRVLRAETEAIFEALPGPKKLKLFPGAGHGLLVRKNRKEWVSAVKNFLK